MIMNGGQATGAYPARVAERKTKSGAGVPKSKTGATSANRPARLGRPPATSSAETRRRILDTARKTFGDMGYDATTNRTLAAEAGITTGALYHYFDSKVDIFLAVHVDATEQADRRFRTTDAEQGTFIEKLHMALETAHALHREDPTLARFLGTARTEIGRHPELRAAYETHDPQRDYFHALVDHGIKTGEIAPEDGDIADSLMRAIIRGLTLGVSNDLERHRLAIDGLKRLFSGTMLRAPANLD